VGAVLIVSPQAEFAEQLRRWAEEAGEKACCATHKAQAVVFAHDEGCTLALLDEAFGEQMLREIGEALRLVMPEIALTVLQGEAPLPPLSSLRPYTLLQKPLSREKFLAFLRGEQEVARPASPPQQRTTEENAWLEDAQRAAGYLTQLTLESSAQAAMILRAGHTWAYAGQLSQDAIRELEQVAQRIARQKAGEVLRFIHLNSTRAEHLLYLSPIEETVLLTLIFDAETPFSVLRAQAHRLTNLLRQGSLPAPAPAPAQTKIPPPVTGIEEEGPASPSFTEILGDVPAPEPEPPAASSGDSIPKEEQAAPSPGPGREAAEKPTPAPLSTVDVAVDAPPSAPPAISLETSPAIPAGRRRPEEAEASDMLAKTRRHALEELEETRKSTKTTAQASEAPSSLAETRRHLPDELEDQELPEPVSAARAAHLLRLPVDPALCLPFPDRRSRKSAGRMGAGNLHRLWLETGIPLHPPRLPAMGGQRAPLYFARNADASDANTDFGAHLCRISKAKEGKSIRRFLGARVSDHGQQSTSSPSTGKKLYPGGATTTGYLSFINSKAFI
jgi:hypothetical protein